VNWRLGLLVTLIVFMAVAAIFTLSGGFMHRD
jgi:hypothetical protein